MMRISKQRGMTLVEIMMVVALIGLLAIALVPAVNFSIRSRQNAQTASQLRRAAAAFELYHSEMRAYPPDQVVPDETTVPDMADYFSDLGIDWWGDETELGGRWDWDVGYHGFAASISIWKPTASAQQMQEFDQLIDDGDLTTGKFRQVSTQYHYILEF